MSMSYGHAPVGAHPYSAAPAAPDYTAYYSQMALSTLNQCLSQMNLQPNVFQEIMRSAQSVSLNNLLSHISTRGNTNDPIRLDKTVFWQLVNEWAMAAVNEVYGNMQRQAQPAMGYPGMGGGYTSSYPTTNGYPMTGAAGGAYNSTDMYRRSTRPGNGTPPPTGYAAPAAVAPAPTGLDSSAYRRPRNNAIPPQPQAPAPMSTPVPPPPGEIMSSDFGIAPAPEPSVEIKLGKTGVPADIDNALGLSDIVISPAYHTQTVPSLETTIQSANLAVAQDSSYNSEEEMIQSIAELVPAELTEGEFVHQLLFNEVHALRIATDTFSGLRRDYADAVGKGKTNIEAILDILDSAPRRVSETLDEFLTELVNRGFSAFLRVGSAVDCALSIDEMSDVTEILSGNWDNAIKQYPDWHAYAERIISLAINVVMEASTFVKDSTDRHLSDLVVASGVNYRFNGRTKYDLVTLDGEEKLALATAILSEYTVIRLTRSVFITNTLTDEDLATTPDIHASPRYTLRERIFITSLNTDRKFGIAEPYPSYNVIFVDENSLDTANIIGTRKIVRCNDTTVLHFV